MISSGLSMCAWELDPQLPCVFDDALSHALAEPAEPPVEGGLVELPSRDGEGGECRPGFGSRGSSRVKRSSNGRAAASRRVKGSPRFQYLAQRRNQRGVAVLLVEDGALRDPGERRGSRAPGSPSGRIGSPSRRPARRGRAVGRRPAERGRRFRPARPSRSAGRYSRCSRPTPTCWTGTRRRCAAGRLRLEDRGLGDRGNRH